MVLFKLVQAQGSKINTFGEICFVKDWVVSVRHRTVYILHTFEQIQTCIYWLYIFLHLGDAETLEYM